MFKERFIRLLYSVFKKPYLGPKSSNFLKHNPKFKAFLKKNNCLQRWADNFEKSSFKISGSNNHDFLNSSFYWEDTPEGHYFWRELYNKEKSRYYNARYKAFREF